MRARKQVGIVLVTTLLMMVLVVMMVTVVVYSGAGGLALAGNFHEREAALLAADSGLQYAMTRMQTNANWRGDSPETAPPPRSGFSVLEEHGNVHGFLTTVSGEASQFRIKFNCEDGAGGVDGLDDTPTGRPRIASSLVSFNNLLGSSAITLPRARESGVGVAPKSAGYEVPKATACILVEGLAGWGLRDATDPSRPGQVTAGRGVTRRVVEAYFSVDFSEMADSAALAAGSIDARLISDGVFSVTSKDTDLDPRLRTLESIDIGLQSGQAGLVHFDDGPDGEVCIGEAEEDHFQVSPSSGTATRLVKGDSRSRFSRITWNSIAKASATSATDSRMKAGTYVWRVDSSGPYLEYFDREYAEGTPLPPAGDGARVDTANATAAGTGVEVDPARLAVVISNNVYVTPSERGAQGIAFRTDPVVTEMAGRPNVMFQRPAGTEKAPILTSAGTVRIEGAVIGTGSVTSEQEIQFQGPSLLEADPETGVSLYAKGDITVEAIPEQVASSRQQFAEYVESSILADSVLPTMDQFSDARVPIGTGRGSGPRGRPDTGDLPDMIDPDQGGADDGREVVGVDANGRGLGLGAPAQAVWEGRGSLATRKLDQFHKVLAKFGRLDYSDQSLAGVLYTWRNFNAKLGGQGVLHVTGTLIAYGGEPDSAVDGAPGTRPDDGRINISARGVDLVYDSTYIKDLLGSTGPVKLKRSLWTTW